MSSNYQKFAGICGILAGIAGLAYLAAFLTLKNPAALFPALFLLLVGILAIPVILALYRRTLEVDENFALLGLLLGIGGAMGAAIHAAFDLTNAIHPASGGFNFASPIDPRGFLTFAIAGLAAITFGWLITRGRAFPHSLGYLGIASGILLVLLYVVYLMLLNPANLILMGLILVSGIVQPVWYLWVGLVLWQCVSHQRVRRAARNMLGMKNC
jgi:hypothetical protein